jgi:putative phosphoribosyl transferase
VFLVPQLRPLAAEFSSMTMSVRVPIGDQSLPGDLEIPADPRGLVLFAHGSGSSRKSPRNQSVARALERRHLATLLIDLLTPEEEAVDDRTRQYRFDIPMLADRLVTIVDWLRAAESTGSLPIGLFGASTGGGAALIAAARRPRDVAAVVSRGGRLDLAGASLAKVIAPTLLIVGGFDAPVIQMNRDAMKQMRWQVTLEIVPGATHLFEEPGTLECVAQLAGDWFAEHLWERRQITKRVCPVCGANGPMLRHDVRAPLIYSCMSCLHEWQIDPADEGEERDSAGRVPMIASPVRERHRKP